MVIGIIGAGLSGLIAGKILSQGGHDVTVFEKSNALEGRLATRQYGENHKNIVDIHSSCIYAHDPVFMEFINELTDKGILKVWAHSFPYHDGEELFDSYPGHEKSDYYYAPEGLDKVGEYLTRWVDTEYNEKVGGFTFIGDKRHSKKAWMMNLTNFNVYEMDAIIVATPAIQAYGLIQTSQDETSIRKLIRDLDQVTYDNSISLIAGYGDRDLPEWKAIQCRDQGVEWIINDSSKRDNPEELTLVIQSTNRFFHKYHKESDEKISQLLLKRVNNIVENDWIDQPDWVVVEQWRYRKPRNPLDVPFLEIDRAENDGPLALIGDYLSGNSIESAYLSGYKLAKHWLEKFPAK
ncbi:MAG TPA: FAD-dependent oxidoreductase [Balneolales bacterium]|nr:FAD-dependent oxidoreductase [Balneolales bacterium]